jgi:(E)-4-hydroxy-3-methylbut-2-enyl-diphosphate synthase
VDTVLEAIENWDEEDEAGDDEPTAAAGDGAPTGDEAAEEDAAESAGVTKPDLPTS